MINDKYGHPIGDKAIRHAADMLVQYVRPYDWVGRWGGEEFLLTLPGADANGAAQAAERIRCNIAEQPLTLENGLVLPFRVSVGVACASPETATADELVRLADEALYRAKREGRDRVCVHRAS